MRSARVVLVILAALACFLDLISQVFSTWIMVGLSPKGAPASFTARLSSPGYLAVCVLLCCGIGAIVLARRRRLGLAASVLVGSLVLAPIVREAAVYLIVPDFKISTALEKPETPPPPVVR